MACVQTAQIYLQLNEEKQSLRLQQDTAIAEIAVQEMAMVEHTTTTRNRLNS